MAEQHEATQTAERQERRDARENRRLLLEVAKRLFAERGVAATTMKDIAEAAGVGKGTLYRHFAHKGELCAALLHEDVTAFRERVGAGIQDTAHEPSPLARLDILITERVRMTETHLPLFAAIEEEAGGGGRARPFRGPFASWTHAQIASLLAEAITRGEVAPLDPELTADVIEAALSPMLYSYQRHECGYSIDRVIDGLRRLFVDGLRRRPASG